MKLITVFIISICTLNAFAIGKKDRILVPEELLQVIKKTYQLDKNSYKPKKIPVEVVFRGEGLERIVKMDKSRRTLDLAGFVSPKIKDFNFSLKSSLKFNDSTRLYFINRYRPLEIGKQKWGAECGKSFIIKSQLDQVFDGKGIKVSVPSGHYLNVIGGDYLLTQVEDKTLFISYFRLRDNRWIERLCKLGF